MEMGRILGGKSDTKREKTVLIQDDSVYVDDCRGEVL